jgi:hypothetical protein
MATSIDDLWPLDINLNVLPPIAVLKAQEGLLARHTNGMLQAKLTTTESNNLVQHQLDLIAPSLNFYRVRLLSATHNREMLYPVTVTSESFVPNSSKISLVAQRLADPSMDQRTAATDEEFIRLVREVLQSAYVRALIHSLIARINQRPDSSQENGPVEPKSDTNPTQGQDS